MRENVFDKYKYEIEVQKAFIVDILENRPPYRFIDFDVKWYSDFNNIKDISITAYCEKCDCTSVFCGNIEACVHNAFSGDIFSAKGRIPVAGYTPPPIERFYEGKEYSLNFEMACAKCGEKHYYSLLFKNNKVCKFGQFPSFTKNEVLSDLKKYKNVIPKYYPELTKSINAFSQGMGVASFVYLRRILEHLIEAKYNGDPSWKFIDKLKEVEKTEQIIPSELSEIKEQIYSILSKGVHEYEEDECIQLYIAVKFVVEQILDLELEKKTRGVKAKEAMKAIQGKLQEDKKNG